MRIFCRSSVSYRCKNNKHLGGPALLLFAPLLVDAERRICSGSRIAAIRIQVAGLEACHKLFSVVTRYVCLSHILTRLCIPAD